MPFRPWERDVTRRLPGVQPLGDAPWLWRDEVFAEQMAYRDALLSDAKTVVLRDASPAIVEELSERIFKHLETDPAYQIGQDSVVRPDGVSIGRDGSLESLARLIQEDILIHEKHGDEHVLVAGVLCFPANWQLSDKVGRTLTGIHIPVPEYSERIARGVQRMFDVMHPDKPIWRANFVTYNSPELHQPNPHPGGGNYIRVERQILTKLARTQSVIFTLHTFISEMDASVRQVVEPLMQARHR